MVISIGDLFSGPWKAYFSHFRENNQEWESMHLTGEGLDTTHSKRIPAHKVWV